MTAEEYSAWRVTMDLYPGTDEETQMLYAATGLCEEAGEVAGKIKKYCRDSVRDDRGYLKPMTDVVRQGIFAELGDALWYLTKVAHKCGGTLQDVIDANVAKLEDRKARGTQRGSGDNR